MCGTSENRLMMGIMTAGAGLSSVLSNTGTTACLMPVVLGICSASKIPASRQLMPLAFAAGLGGTITLVGTPPNMIANVALRSAELPGFDFFEFAWIGIPLTIAGIIYMVFIGKHLLPKADLDANQKIEQEIDATSHDQTKQIIAGAVLLGVVVFMALNFRWMPLHMAAMTGAIICVLTKCLTEKQAYAAVDWTTICLLGGMLPVATALDQSGAARLIAQHVVAVMGGDPSPYVVMAVLFAVTCALTQFMSNTAAAALLCPVGLGIAASLGADPKAVIMAICISASCAFATPVGTPPNTLVLGPGGYKFADYIKPGLGLIVVGFTMCMLIIPVVWPFFP
jgi:anion transporter